MIHMLWTQDSLSSLTTAKEQELRALLAHIPTMTAAKGCYFWHLPQLFHIFWSLPPILDFLSLTYILHL